MGQIIIQSKAYDEVIVPELQEYRKFHNVKTVLKKCGVYNGFLVTHKVLSLNKAYIDYSKENQKLKEKNKCKCCDSNLWYFSHGLQLVLRINVKLLKVPKICSILFAPFSGFNKLYK